MVTEEKFICMFCKNCPRHCRIESTRDKFCQAPEKLKIGLWQLFYGEEPSISGENGSGAIFFSHCNLRCVFCQNYQISQLNKGKIITDDEFLEICYRLKAEGAHNINLISPTVYHQRLIGLLRKLKRQEFDLPIVWNSNAYELPENIKALRGLVDIYLPDFKYGDDKLALKYSLAPNYSQIAQKAIREMFLQKSSNIYNKNGMMRSGLIVRHLVLPSSIENSKIVLKWLRVNLGAKVQISLLSQYTPLYRASLFPEISRPLTKDEYDEISQYALSLGFENIYFQELSSVGKEFIPEFDFQ